MNNRRNVRRSPRNKGRRTGRGGCLFVLFGVCLLTFSVWQGWKEWMPNFEYATPDTTIKQPITWQGNSTSYGAYGSGKSLMIPLSIIQNKIIPQAIYEAASNQVILTNDSDVAALPLNATKGIWNGEIKDWKIATQEINGEIYVPMAVLEKLGVAQAFEYEESGAVQLVLPGEQLQYGETVQSDKPDVTYTMREQPDRKAAIVKKLPAQAKITIWDSQDGWVHIQDDEGSFGYIQESAVKKTDVWSMPAAEAVEKPSFVQNNTPVSLAWEAVYSRNPDPEALPDMPGVNVISPTWFSLADDEGNVNAKANKELVKWAHAENKHVWALYSNSFEPERTTESLATFERRNRTIQQLLQFMKQYDLDGINIDYENVNVEDRDKLTQLVRELTPQFHRQGLVVSIDVTAKSTSGNWSMFLDREALGRSVDYMMVMAYDEHWASSPKAGSVASLPWAEQSVQRIMDEDNVPASKLVLGMPLYTRIWTETVENGETKVSSKAVGMETIKQWIADNKLTPVMNESTGQHYAELTLDGETQRVWIEDTTSIQARIDMAKQMNLAGVAVWARTFGDDSIWKVLNYS